MIVDHRVNRIRVVQVGLDVIDEKVIGYAGQPFNGPPIGSAVLTDLDATVVGACIEQPFDQG